MKKTLFFMILIVATIAISSCEKDEMTNQPTKTEVKDDGVLLDSLIWCMTAEEKQSVYDFLDVDPSDANPIIVGTCTKCGCTTKREPYGFGYRWVCSNALCPDPDYCGGPPWCPPQGPDK